MKKIKLIVFAVAAATIACGAGIANAQERGLPRAMVYQADGTRHGEDLHEGNVDRDHRHRPVVIIVAVPIFVGSADRPLYLAPPIDAYRTLDGFYYYCGEPAGFYPTVQDCASGWRLVP